MLTDLACKLRASALFTQTGHWNVQGMTFPSDHALLDKIYTTLNEAVDSMAERAMGMGESIDGLSPYTQAQFLAATPECDFTDDNAVFAAILDMLVELLVDLSTENFNSVRTIGTQNLLAQVADDIEQLVYLIQQRLK